MTMTVGGTRRRPARRWISAPLALCAAATLLAATPLRVAGLQAPEPIFALVPAFAWAALRPSWLAPAALFGLGLGMDLLWGTPLGLWPVCLIGAHAFCLAVRRYLAGEDFAVLWVWYAAACAVAFVIGALATGLIDGKAPNLLGVGEQWLVSAALFPLAYALMDRYQVADGRLR